MVELDKSYSGGDIFPKVVVVEEFLPQICHQLQSLANLFFQLLIAFNFPVVYKNQIFILLVYIEIAFYLKCQTYNLLNQGSTEFHIVNYLHALHIKLIG